MAFNPDEYLAQKTGGQGFNPDEYLSEKSPEMSAGEVAGQAVSNIIPSIGGVVKGVAESVLHPIETAKNIGKAVIGAGEIGTEKLAGLINPELVSLNKQLNAPSQEQQLSGNIGDYYKQRYGSVEGFKQALAKDPAGVMADLSTVLTAGSSAVPSLAKVASVVDPLSLTAKGVTSAAQLAGKGVQAGLGMTTGAGAEAIKQAYLAGKEGGQAAEKFQANLRGNVPMTDVLDTAKADLAAMNAKKSAEYRQNMKAVSADKSTLDFSNIDKSLIDAYNTVTYKGMVKNDKGAQILKEISDQIGDWKRLNPGEYHTPEGMDALKQVIGGIVESIPFEEKTARMVGNSVYNSIKNEIVKQAPGYSKTMQDYAQASDQIKEIERALSLGQKSAADTAMRKLQSLMRNNASTNYGNRLKLAQELEQTGGGKIMPSLAGQALNTLTPRGLQSATTIPAALMAGPAVLAAASPRLVGEATYYAGKGAKLAEGGARGVNSLAELIRTNPRVAANLLYQAQQPK